MAIEPTMISMILRLGLIFACLCCIGCPADPEPSPMGDGTTDATAGSSEDTIASSSTSSDTSATSATSAATTGANVEDCDTIDDPTVCDSVAGLDFECAWVSDVYAVQLDGPTCSTGDAVGRCVAVVDVGDTSCYEEYTYQCADGSSLDFTPYLETDEGLVLLADSYSFQNIIAACNEAPQWQICDGMGGPAACECACELGLRQ